MKTEQVNFLFPVVNIELFHLMTYHKIFEKMKTIIGETSKRELFHFRKNKKDLTLKLKNAQLNCYFYNEKNKHID